ncbi:hypothetical protein PV08_07565 [Exophiala spinifera]|uniref:Uncharacterized protein n=1 Tax=Exophiala spinifera TaxID=91928 RepID=A0A0D2B7X1_9EURO|nr:uncharacterized protein PV08_07565 [Exophiala spinifera]KIW14780.1 hypothetical protein PV08_07565 [Exophiala spinifera]
MGSGSRFHLPASLKRTKSTATDQVWKKKTGKREYKAQNILGISEAALNTARNESVSSSNTVKVPTLSFSDAATEFGSSTAATEKPDGTPELKLKASSVLLHEDFCISSGKAASVHSKRPKPHPSSSTLNSHYEAQKMPLAISQQTSESSRRDGALRKGSPIVMKSNTPEKEPSRQLRLFRSTKHQDKSGSKKFTKLKSESPVSPPRSLLSSQRSVASAGHPREPISTQSSKGSVSHRGSYYPHELGPRHTPNFSMINAKRPKPYLTHSDAAVEISQVKINIRRPKVGAKHWFDGLEGDSSEDESVHEPEFQPSFVDGMESAFEDGRIGLVSKDPAKTSTFISNASDGRAILESDPSTSSSSRYMLPDSAIPPRTSTLNAKSSKSTLCQELSRSRHSQHVSGTKSISKTLASSDLHTTSILDLSSSDDEEGRVELGHGRLPQLRDSIALESLMESDIVVETAKAIETNQNASIQATPSLRRLARNASKRNARTSTKASSRPLNIRQSYSNTGSFQRPVEEQDLLTSFPATPTDSRRTSFQGSCLSDNASIESRRMVSVTKQEESLLAAIRLRSTISQHAKRSTDPRLRLLRDLEKISRHQQVPAGLISHEISRINASGQEALNHSDGNSDQASCTTFQTGRSADPSIRFSMASFQTETSLGHDSEMSFLPSPNFAPVVNGAKHPNRASFFSTSTNDSQDTASFRREHNHKAALKKLSSIPSRDDIPSQEFIDWPYHGWEARSSTLATAH